jgi:decaprenyl-phosphate phosphoribosyltransferase
MKLIHDWLRLLRVRQYIKNLFILAPAFFAGMIPDSTALLRLSLGFIAFCSAASAVYIFNDLRDRDYDRRHPQKRAATHSLPDALLHYRRSQLPCCYSGGAVVVGFFLADQTLLYLGLYLGINILYSLRLKHIPILDVTLVAVGFPLRLFFGGAIVAVPLSTWIILATFLLALFIALGKRRDDVLLQAEGEAPTRASVDGYNLEFTQAGMLILGAVVIVTYILYTVSPEVQAHFTTDHLYLTTLFVIVGILRYFQQVLVHGRGGNPTELMYSDRFLQLVILLWVLSFAALIYLGDGD